MQKVSQDDLETFGRAVKQARTLRGATLEDLGTLALARDGAKGFLSQIEKGKRQISALTAGKLVTELDLDKSLLDPFLGENAVQQDEITKADRDAERLLSRARREEVAPDTGQALLIALAYEFAEGQFLDLQTSYQGLRSALEAAQKIKERGELPSNTGDQVQRIMREVARLNEADLRDEAAELLEAEMQWLEAERDSIFNLQLEQDRVRNRPAEAASRLIRNLSASAPPGGVWNATRDLIIEWRDRGEKQGPPFDLQVALAKGNWKRARGGQKGVSLIDIGICQNAIGERSGNAGHLKSAINAYTGCLKLVPRRKDAENWAVTQNNLGNALSSLGEREQDPARLREAIAAYEEALTVRTREAVPMDWAKTQSNLGLAHRWLGALTGQADHFDLAQTDFALCLEELRPDTVPFLWAQTPLEPGRSGAGAVPAGARPGVAGSGAGACGGGARGVCRRL
ncbi:MAG: helix-turn-helix transcriptional regulator [Rhodobacteraceae bacterium]|nr:helix-turn-helix transcriptional regulator [Paracoccaceae bacterium]